MAIYMKSNSTTTLTLYPFLRQITIRRSTATGVTSGIEATGLPFPDQPSSTVARGMRLRSTGALSLRTKGRIAAFSVRISFIGKVNRSAAKVSTPVKSHDSWGCQFSSVYQGVR